MILLFELNLSCLSLHDFSIYLETGIIIISELWLLVNNEVISHRLNKDYFLNCENSS